MKNRGQSIFKRFYSSSDKINRLVGMKLNKTYLRDIQRLIIAGRKH